MDKHIYLRPEPSELWQLYDKLVKLSIDLSNNIEELKNKLVFVNFPRSLEPRLEVRNFEMFLVYGYRHIEIETVILIQEQHGLIDFYEIEKI